VPVQVGKTGIGTLSFAVFMSAGGDLAIE